MKSLEGLEDQGRRNEMAVTWLQPRSIMGLEERRSRRSPRGYRFKEM